MISADLARAKTDGVAVAALTASEATIYGRFGFGPATHYRTMQVDTGPNFALNTAARQQRDDGGGGNRRPRRCCLDLEPELFDAAARRLLRLGRPAGRLPVPGASGAWTYEQPEPDKAVRAAVHYGPDGQPDGYVSYKFAGWDDAGHR